MPQNAQGGAMNDIESSDGEPAVFGAAPQLPPGWAVAVQHAAPVKLAAASAQNHGVAMLMMAAGAGRDALGGVLASVGFSLMAFDSPLAVAQHLYGVRPTVVLVDCASGGNMAAQVVAWLRLAGIPSPVVLMGNMTPALVEQMTRAGVNHCVQYPADLGAFAAQVVVASHAGVGGACVPAPLGFSSVVPPPR